MNFERLIRKLNKQLGDEFGYNPQGEPKFKWIHSTGLFCYVEQEAAGYIKSGALYLPNHSYQRQPWSDLIGKGWVLASWKPAVPEREWLATVGTAYAWPQHGEYYPVENWMVMDEAAGVDLPNCLTRETEHVRYALRIHLGNGPGDFIRECTEKAEKHKAGEKAQWADAVDDAMTAFGNIPGSKSTGVSFPSVTPKPKGRNLIQ